MRNDHIQGILFTEQNTLDLSQRSMAGRMVRSLSGKTGSLSKKLHLRKATNPRMHSGSYAFDAKSQTYHKDIADVAARLRTTPNEEE